MRGQAAEGLGRVAEALSTINKTRERWCEAELYRLKDVLTLQSQTSLERVSAKSKPSQGTSEVSKAQILNLQSHAEAEACFLKAVEIVRRQSAKSLELRVVTSLSRLWQSQGKQAEAHRLLSEIYGWFTEGFDTKDLQEAKAPLDELA